MHLRTLSTDAPAVFKAVSKVFQEHESNTIAGIYSESCRNGLDQEWFARDQGVSATPRPARLIQLALESGAHSIEGICHAVACAQDIECLDDFKGNFEPGSAIPAAPYCLDWLRHVHLISEAPLRIAGRKSIKEIHAIVCKLTDTCLSPGCDLPELMKKN